MNISGNYDTKTEEIRVVKAYLERENIPYKEQKIKAYSDADGGDVKVVLKNNVYSLFEVKQESIERWKNTVNTE